MIEQARRRGLRGVGFRQAQADALPFRDGWFDAADDAARRPPPGRAPARRVRGARPGAPPRRTAVRVDVRRGPPRRLLPRAVPAVAGRGRPRALPAGGAAVQRARGRRLRPRLAAPGRRRAVSSTGRRQPRGCEPGTSRRSRCSTRPRSRPPPASSTRRPRPARRRSRRPSAGCWSLPSADRPRCYRSPEVRNGRSDTSSPFKAAACEPGKELSHVPASVQRRTRAPRARDGGVVMATVSEKTLLDAEQIDRTLRRIAHEIVEREGQDLERGVLVGIYTRGVPLASRLRRMIAEIAGSSCRSAPSTSRSTAMTSASGARPRPTPSRWSRRRRCRCRWTTGWRSWSTTSSRPAAPSGRRSRRFRLRPARARAARRAVRPRPPRAAVPGRLRRQEPADSPQRVGHRPPDGGRRGRGRALEKGGLG